MTGHKIVEEDESGVIPMSEMGYGEWAIVLEGVFAGHTVRRTTKGTQIDDMSIVSYGMYWDGRGVDLKVRPIPSGTRLTIEIT